MPFRFAPLVVAALAFGLAVSFNHGAYDDHAIALVLGGVLTLAWIFADVLGVFAEEAAPSRARRAGGGLVVALTTGVLWAYLDPSLIIYAQVPWFRGRAALAGLLVLLLSHLPALVAGWREPRALRWARFSLCALLVLIAGADVLHASPRPWIDVFTVQQRGAEALLGGQNPYTQVSVDDTTPGRSLKTPYVYPPTQILAGLPGYALFDDVRWSMLFAMLAAGVCLRILTERAAGRELPSIALDAPALLLWCTPKLFFILEQAWVDPIQLALVCGGFTLFARDRRDGAAVVFGLAASSKQTLFWIVPLVGFGLRLRPREWLILGAAAAAPLVPFMLWDFGALKRSIFDFLTQLPPRPDALTLGNFINRRLGTGYAGTAAFPLTALVVALGALRARGPGPVAACIAFAYALFFAVNKQAFANYYVFVVGLCALAAATALSDLGARETAAAPAPANTTAGSTG